MSHYMQSRQLGHGRNFNGPKRLSWSARVTFCAKLLGILLIILRKRFWVEYLIMQHFNRFRTILKFFSTKISNVFGMIAVINHLRVACCVCVA